MRLCKSIVEGEEDEPKFTKDQLKEIDVCVQDDTGFYKDMTDITDPLTNHMLEHYPEIQVYDMDIFEMQRDAPLTAEEERDAQNVVNIGLNQHKRQCHVSDAIGEVSVNPSETCFKDPTGQVIKIHKPLIPTFVTAESASSMAKVKIEPHQVVDIRYRRVDEKASTRESQWTDKMKVTLGKSCTCRFTSALWSPGTYIISARGYVPELTTPSDWSDDSAPYVFN